jgi:hypothetical protein
MNSIAEIIQHLERQAIQAAHQTLWVAGQRGIQLASQQTSFHASDSFNQAIQFTPTSQTEGFVMAHKSYAQFLEYGNQEQGEFIEPVNKKALANVRTGFGPYKKVRSHPGYFFMEKAAAQLETELPALFETELSKII